MRRGSQCVLICLPRLGDAVRVLLPILSLWDLCQRGNTKANKKENQSRTTHTQAHNRAPGTKRSDFT